MTKTVKIKRMHQSDVWVQRRENTFLNNIEIIDGKCSQKDENVRF